MAGENDPKDVKSEETGKSRRGFVRNAAQVAVTAPAAMLLLSATTKQAAATITAYEASQNHILDDFTFGNTEEDIDARAFQSNFNPINGKANQDDHWPL